MTRSIIRRARFGGPGPAGAGDPGVGRDPSGTYRPAEVSV